MNVQLPMMTQMLIGISTCFRELLVADARDRDRRA